MATDGLGKRFAWKVAGNLAAVALGLAVTATVPRSLGPIQYGQFDFVTTTFRLILETALLQVPVAYFNWVSRNASSDRVRKVTLLTVGFYASIGLVFFLVLEGLKLFGWASALWPGVLVPTLTDAFAFTFLFALVQLFTYYSDGVGLTARLEKVKLAQNVIKTVVLVTLVYFGVLTLQLFFWIQTFLFVAVCVVSFFWMRKDGRSSGGSRFSDWWSDQDLRDFAVFVVRFVRPLILLSLVGLLFMFFDRWILQASAGSKEQGYFGISDRIGQMAFIFTSALTPLLTREFAVHHAISDFERLRVLFGKIRQFYYIVALLCSFVVVNSDLIVGVFGGRDYQAAGIVLAIMAFLPIHQTFGQLSGSYMIASGRTRLYSIIGITALILGAPLSFVLVARSPGQLGGLDLGAVGLAIKLVIVQVVSTNFQLYFNCKDLKLSFARWLSFQVLVVAILLCSGVVVRWAFETIARLSNLGVNNFLELLVSGGIYVVLSIALTMRFPWLAGMSKDEISSAISSLAKRN